MDGFKANTERAFDGSIEKVLTLALTHSLIWALTFVSGFAFDQLVTSGRQRWMVN